MDILNECLLFLTSFCATFAEITNKWEVRYTPESRIVGGFEPRPHSHPYMVSLQTRFLWARAHFCGGSLLNKHWILTAGHCVKESWIIQWLPMDAVAGVHNVDHFESKTQVVTVGERITHPLYEGALTDKRECVGDSSGHWSQLSATVADQDRQTEAPQRTGPAFGQVGIGAHDIAVLKTKKPFVFTKEVRPINLPQATYRLIKGEALSLSGWGLLRTTMFIPDLPSRLQEVKVTYMTYKDCYNAIEAAKEDNEENPLVEESNICTGPIKGGIAACNGDSGGPLVLYAPRNRFSTPFNKTVAIKEEEIDEIDNEIDSYEEEYFDRKIKPEKQKKDDDIIPTVFGVVSWGISPCGEKGAPTVYTKVLPHLDFVNSLIHT